MACPQKLKALKHQRNGYRLNADNQLKIFDDLCGQDGDLGQIEPAKLRLVIESLLYYQDKLDTLDSAILDQLEDEMVADVQHTSQSRERVLHTIKSAEILLGRLEKSKPDSSEIGSIDGESSRSRNTKASVRLPKLEIKQFAGDPLQWQEFWDSFQSTINSNADLATVDKFKYLKGYLASQALQVIDGYRVTEDNYQTVIEALQERFGNPEIAVFAHFEKLLALPSGDHTSVRLQKIYDECEKHIRSLVALGLAEDTFGQVFTPIILSKLPRGIRIQLHRNNGSKPWRLSNLRELMEEEIQAREMSDRLTTKEDPQSSKAATPKFPSSSKPMSKVRFPSQGALVSESKTKIQCSYCKGQHYADLCNVYSTFDQRKSQLNGKCFKCLVAGHSSKECSKKSLCFYCKQANHHSSLCLKQFGSATQQTKRFSKPVPNESSSKKVPSTDTNLLQTGTQVHMQMAVVKFQNNVKARIFFDTGSSRSYITSSLSRTLGIKPTDSETLSVAKFGDKRRKTVTYKRAELMIPTKDESSQILLSALITDTITCPIQKYPINLSTHPILSRIPLADPISETVQSVSIDILVGSDHYHDFIGTERVSLDDGFFLVNSRFGYIPTVKVQAQEASECTSVMLLRHSSSLPVSNFDLERFWALEDIGVKDNAYQADDERALQIFNDTIRLADGRYEVTWPWKQADPNLPSNFGLAVGRLKSLVTRIKGQPQVLQSYNDTLKDQLQMGVIEEVKSKETPNRVHYIPHHCVIKADKATTKLRIVYDGSAKSGKMNPSLNDCLLRGPIILHDLAGLLLRFRLSKIAMTCDIEKAFLQVGIQEHDRDVTRFLWLKDPTQPLNDANLTIFRFCRVPFGIISSPFLLAATVKHHLSRQTSNVASVIADNIYVDNVLVGKNDVSEAVDFYQETKALFSSISMNIREWYSNSSEFCTSIDSNDRGKSVTPKVLGMIWNLPSDTFNIPPLELTDANFATKRQLLKFVSAVYDPCGLFSPVTVRGKNIIQNIWKEKLPWDSQLPEKFLKQFQEVITDLRGISSVKIPRLLSAVTINATAIHEIHCFCDASSKAYGAAVYLRSMAHEKEVSVNLLFSKSRLAPVKTVSLPRLELMAVVVGVRVSEFVKQQLRLPIAKVVVWTDSKCVLHWINSSKVLSVFVQNRVREIKQHPFQYRYVPTTCNPADIPSRGATLPEIESSYMWWFGPKFLLMRQDMWPENEFAENETSFQLSVNSELATDAGTSFRASEVTEIGNIVTAENYSSLSKLLRVTGWIMRFIHNCRQSSRDRDQSLSRAEIAEAERLWVSFVQSQSYPNCLSDKKPQGFVLQLSVFRDSNGLLRCRGRLQNSSLDTSAKQPKLLPKNNHFTNLVIQNCHERVFHSGVSQVLSQVRYEYWIPHGRSQVRRVLRNCRICRRTEGGPFKVPDNPPLPSFRVSQSHPFSCVGIDYLGPLFIKSEIDSAADLSKVWICLFTCAAIRAVHLEVVTDMTTEQFLMCLRRFSSIYGRPKSIISDNARTFKSADKVVKMVFRSKCVQEFSTTEGIEWKFIPELAPWMGGFYERLVGSVKRALRKSLGQSCLTLIQLQTIIAEVSAVINSRPLVPTASDCEEVALTPAHFLAKSGRTGLPDYDSIVGDEDFHLTIHPQQRLLETWAKGKRLLDQFWRTWKNEYLAHLRERPSRNLSMRNSSEIALKPGVVVVVKEDLPRCRWKLAKIEAVHVGEDGQSRYTSISLLNGKKLTRPLKLLYPVEEGCPIAQKSETSESPVAGQHSRKARRQAHTKALEAIKRQIASDSEEFDN